MVTSLKPSPNPPKGCCSFMVWDWPPNQQTGRTWEHGTAATWPNIQYPYKKPPHLWFQDNYSYIHFVTSMEKKPVYDPVNPWLGLRKLRKLSCNPSVEMLTPKTMVSNWYISTSKFIKIDHKLLLMVQKSIKPPVLYETLRNLWINYQTSTG